MVGNGINHRDIYWRPDINPHSPSPPTRTYQFTVYDADTVTTVDTNSIVGTDERDLTAHHYQLWGSTVVLIILYVSLYDTASHDCVPTVFGLVSRKRKSRFI